MHILVVGVNHKTAPVEIREKLAVSSSHLPAVVSSLRHRELVRECAILSTCNRTEVYAVLESARADVVTGFLADLASMDPGLLEDKLYRKADAGAVSHLLRVAAGLDSMVIGESQVLNQVKEAFQMGVDAGGVGTVLSGLFRQALVVGKRARTETEISRGAVSVSHAAVSLAQTIFGDLRGHTGLIVGAGEMSEITVRLLMEHGVASVIVANRTHERAEQLAREFGGRAVFFHDLVQEMAHADIVISSTGAQRAIVHLDSVKQVLRLRRQKPIFIIDMAVPRDVEPEVGELDNVFLYNIDDLRQVVQENLGERQKEVASVEAIIGEETERFIRWLRSLEVVPMLNLLQARLEEIRLSEWQRIAGKLSHLSPRDREAVESFGRAMIKKILHRPMTALKESAQEGNRLGQLELLRELFGLTGGQEPALQIPVSGTTEEVSHDDP